MDAASPPEAPRDNASEDKPLPARRLTTTDREVWALASPTLAETFLVSLVGIVDMVQVGRLGAAAITSVGLTNQSLIIVQTACQALMTGTTAMVARSFGERKDRQASEVLKQSFYVTIPIGLLISILTTLYAGHILRFMKAGADVLQVGVPYYQVVGAGFVLNAIALVIAAALRGAGDTRTPMKINLTANLVNVVLNAMLIWGLFGFPRWEVFGAGVATTVSRLVAAVWFLLVAVKGAKRVKLDFRERYKPHMEILRKTYTIGIAAAVEQILLRSAHVLFARVVSSLGTVVFASHQVGISLMQLTFMPGQAFSTAATALVSRQLGAGSPRDAEKYANSSWKIASFFGFAMCALFLAGGKYFALLYTHDMEVVLGAALVLRIYSLAQPFQATQFALGGCLRGAGDTMYALYSTVIGMWFGRLAVGWFFVSVLGWGLPGAWAAMTLDQTIRGILMYLRYRTGRWKDSGVWHRTPGRRGLQQTKSAAKT